MKHFLILAIVLLPAAVSAQTDLVTLALNQFGLDSSNIGYRPKRTWNTAPHVDGFRLPWFDDLLARPLKVPAFTQRMLWDYNVYALADSANMAGYHANKVRPLAMMVVNSAQNLGCDIGKYGFDYTPNIDSANPLPGELRALYQENGGVPGDLIVYPLPTQDWSDNIQRFEAQLRALPSDLQRAIASILAASREAARYRNDALRRIPRGDWQHIYTSTTLEESQCDAHTFDQTVYDAAAAFDVASCAWGAALLAQAIEKALPVIQAHRGESYEADIPTPLGRIVLSGGNSDNHYAGDCLLLIDFGGDDAYYGSAAATGPGLPVSVLIDAGGNDRYENRHLNAPSQGAGVLGIAVLADLEGSDVYVSRTFSQGCGRFGVGLLYDLSGSDKYLSEGFSQGAGMYGIGVSLDLAGDDEYQTVYYAQGYGFSKGLGLLMDVRGDDTYRADDEHLTHIGDETPKHNESDAQGFGAGRRGDHTDGHNMSGGIGILNDLSGDDSYSAGVFAQGSAYWYGYGILNDAAGNDKYRGVFFNLGAAAHYGIGCLFEGSGNDYSELVMTLGFGTGHDGSAAFYLDFNGNDTYEMTQADNNAASLGTSLNSSFSFFGNIRGNDTYKTVGRSFGYAMTRNAGERAQFGPTTGMFIDLGGDDTYLPGQPPANGGTPANNTRWLSAPTDKGAGIYSIGIDTDEGLIRFERE